MISVHFAGCQATRAEALNGGRMWRREPDEEIEDFEKRFELISRSAVQSRRWSFSPTSRERVR